MTFEGWKRLNRFEKICTVLCAGAVLTGALIHYYVRREIPWRTPASLLLNAFAMLAAAGAIRRKYRTEAVVLVLGAVGWCIFACTRL
jgi:hypothetical protein